VLGPDFAKETLGLDARSFAVVVLPLGFGIVTGVLLLNSYGRYFPRRRVIEGGLIALGILLVGLAGSTTILFAGWEFLGVSSALLEAGPGVRFGVSEKGRSTPAPAFVIRWHGRV
jgi:hypothetical protein